MGIIIYTFMCLLIQIDQILLGLIKQDERERKLKTMRGVDS